MNPFINEETWQKINLYVEIVTALPEYENGVLGDYPDFIFLGVICHVKEFDDTQYFEYDCTVTLKFQSTFDDTFEYHVLNPDGNITTIGEI